MICGCLPLPPLPPSACSGVLSPPRSVIDTYCDTGQGANSNLVVHTTRSAMATEEAEVMTAAVSGKGNTVRFQKVRFKMVRNECYTETLNP